jgi:dynactin-4
MAAKALHREIPGMAAVSARTRGGMNAVKSAEDRVGWDEMKEYEAKGRCAGLEVDKAVELEELREGEWAGAVAGIEQTWGKSWDGDRRTK